MQGENEHLSATPSPLPFPTDFNEDQDVIARSAETVVYRTAWRRSQRPLAVKRVAKRHVVRAWREADVLEMLDPHSNVTRSRGHHETEDFIYIAMDLSIASLQDVISNIADPLSTYFTFAQEYQNTDLRVRKHYLEDMARGLAHLHEHNIVHRAVQPSNFLFYARERTPNKPRYCLVITDFAWCRMMAQGQSSFLPSAYSASPEIWLAPEVLESIQQTLDEATMQKDTKLADDDTRKDTRRLRRSLDIFSLGCVFYYALTTGCHPFGDVKDPNSIDTNVEHGSFNLDGLPPIARPEGSDIISKMITNAASERPTAEQCLEHPLLWDETRKPAFLADFIEMFKQQPRGGALSSRLDKEAPEDARGDNWLNGKVSIGEPAKAKLQNLPQYGDGTGFRDLIRAIRNLWTHYYQNDTRSAAMRADLGPTREDAWQTFAAKFPGLIMYLYKFVSTSPEIREQLEQYMRFPQ